MKKVGIVLVGCGNVGQSLLELLDANQGYRGLGVELTVQAVFDRGGGILVGDRSPSEVVAAKRRNGSVTGLTGAAAVDLAGALEGAREPILVDTSVTDAETGGAGLNAARAALERGVSVVFASKGPLVVAYHELAELARRRQAQLGISAALGIPLPSLEIGLYGLRGAELRRLRAVLNDTANQILRDLESGISLEACIEQARLDGIIEEDESLDLDGWDATYKLLILARVFWDPEISLASIRTTGIGAIGGEQLRDARARGERIRLIATGERREGGTWLRTEPERLSSDDPFYDLGPGEKGAVFETGVMGTISVRSDRGGPQATAACVLKDILNIGVPPRPFSP